MPARDVQSMMSRGEDSNREQSQGAHGHDSENKRHRYEIRKSSERGVRGMPDGHTCYKAQKGMCQAEIESKRIKKDDIGGKKVKVDKVSKLGT